MKKLVCNDCKREIIMSYEDYKSLFKEVTVLNNGTKFFDRNDLHCESCDGIMLDTFE